MEIKKSKNKVKIILEYPRKLMDFGIISKNDLDNLHLKIFTKKGYCFTADEIQEITFAIKDALDEEGKNG